MVLTVDLQTMLEPISSDWGNMLRFLLMVSVAIATGLNEVWVKN